MKRIIAGILVSLCLVLSLAGCGGETKVITGSSAAKGSSAATAAGGEYVFKAKDVEIHINSEAKAVLDKKYDFVVDRLYDCARFAVESGVLNTVATPANGKEMPEARDVRVTLQNKGYIPIRDSVGNVLLNLRVKVDGYTFDNV